ncbi:MAG: GNAT family N-acetyltransferase [Gammaproteobacteria bacterium]|nr:GNAT family N-acetyltransferase [Gammaproteobacteria bacterium]
MKHLEWKCKRFDQLSNNQLYELLKLRVDIFVVEQTCVYTELDEKDRLPDTYHLMAYDNNQLVAYARLLSADTSYSDCSIGRFLVESTWRHQGIGSLLMQKCLEQITILWPENDIRISAQVYLKEFYESFEFYQVSEPYLEDGIPHLEMLKNAPHD